jgi:hypothetical protein
VIIETCSDIIKTGGETVRLLVSLPVKKRGPGMKMSLILATLT